MADGRQARARQEAVYVLTWFYGSLVFGYLSATSFMTCMFWFDFAVETSRREQAGKQKSS